jgi:hypothetical protein
MRSRPLVLNSSQYSIALQRVDLIPALDKTASFGATVLFKHRATNAMHAK